ncbi:MAG: NADH-quinone oxidoreductase subunit A [Varibaculum sp.]|nr:NADH-quinone oxidoreductase subunit A [Varibaculum sp.]
MNPAVAILIMTAVALALAVGGLAMSALFSPNRWNRTKVESYECGSEPTRTTAADGRFPIKYYLVAMIFIIFDIEVVFLYPWAVSISAFGPELGVIALIDILLFVVLLTIPFVYLWRRGGLEY